MAHSYGAQLTPKQYFLVVVALCAGTLIEWFDFTVFSQLSVTLSLVFFPKTGGDPRIQQIQFWGVYAAGFIARPLGSIMFGHLGDTYGRRTVLLISVLWITVPTVLIGCMPSYQMAGIAAPILLVILRFLQGLGLGGEYGSAIVYLYEIAPPAKKGLLASIGESSAEAGCIVGIVVVLAVVAATTEEQLLLYGWRVPFLLVSVTATFAVVLRWHMPESNEFLASKQQKVNERVASIAAHRVMSRMMSAQQPSTPGQQQPSMRSLHSIASGRRSNASVLGSMREQQLLEHLQSKGSIILAKSTSSNSRIPSTGGCHHHHQQKEVLSSCDSPAAFDALPSPDSIKQQLSSAVALDIPPLLPEEGPYMLSGTEDLEAEVGLLQNQIKHHVPLKVLFTEHWKQLLSFWLLLASYGCTFYVFFTFLPAYLINIGRATQETTLWIVLIELVCFMVMAPVAGHLADKGLRKVWAYMAVTALLAAVSVPVIKEVSTGSIASMWALQPLMLGLQGLVGGWATNIGNQLFVPAVRTTGYNFGFSCAMALFGGLCPLAASSLSLVLPYNGIAAALLIIFTSVLSLAAGAAILWHSPHVNARNSVKIMADMLQLQHDQQQRGQLVTPGQQSSLWTRNSINLSKRRSSSSNEAVGEGVSPPQCCHSDVGYQQCLNKT